MAFDDRTVAERGGLGEIKGLCQCGNCEELLQSTYFSATEPAGFFYNGLEDSKFEPQLSEPDLLLSIVRETKKGNGNLEPRSTYTRFKSMRLDDDPIEEKEYLVAPKLFFHELFWPYKQRIFQKKSQIQRKIRKVSFLPVICSYLMIRTLSKTLTSVLVSNIMKF